MRSEPGWPPSQAVTTTDKRAEREPAALASGLDRICEELEAVTALAGHYQAPWELSEVVRRTYRHALATA
jgi:hypothetical protein